MPHLPHTAAEPWAGRFVIEREVGRGGVGIVYRAQDLATLRSVALKVIAVTGVDAGEEARFSREGRLLSELDHAGIVRVVAFGALGARRVDPSGRVVEEGTPYVAMEWLEGEDLSVRQKRAPLTTRQALEVSRQVASALAAAHEAGIVHRDIKPSNIFLVGDRDGGESARPVAKLVDFGVAAADDVRLTRTGAVVGTPAYMAPEQARGDAGADARSDLYSLGAMIFELIAGRPPHVGPTSIATLARLVTTPAPALSEVVAEVPERLDHLVRRLLASDPELRPSSAAAVAEELVEILADPTLPDLGRPVSREDARSTVHGTRLVTTIVAIHVPAGEGRQRELQHLREHGADAVPLGQDGIVAHLGARRAHGDEATRALELARHLASLGARVGVATGRMHVNLTRPSGEVVDRAATIAREAPSEKALTDRITAELARGRFEFVELVSGWSAVGEPLRGTRRGGAGGPFVGRDAELIAALSAFERCADDQTPVLVSISGPPGIGKSRLGREIHARVAGHAEPPRIVQVHAESFGRGHALGVAADILRGLLGLSKGTSLEQAEEAIANRRLLHAAGGGLLALLLANRPFPEGLDPRGARDSLWLVMTELIVAETGHDPCALLLEDMQWADPESIAWLDHVLGRAAGRPLFVLLLLRPGFWRDSAQRFTGRDHLRLELRPMARRATREIARAVIGQSVEDAVLDRVAEQSAGSPLFAEELARVIATGKDARNTPTIEAAIQVSLDALDDATRDAVVQMSVFGVAVWEAGIEALGVPNAALVLRRLSAAELLVEHAESRFAATREFRFKHALVRDVAYTSLGEEAKRELHAAAARWLLSMREDAATVAQHFDLGGRHEEAARHWEAAARRALATNALSDAVAMADRALVFALDRPTAFARALLLDEAWSRLDARSSERDSAIRAMQENVFDEASELRAKGARARYDHARASGSLVEERLIAVRDRAAALGLVDEEARCTATLATRLAFAGQPGAAEREAVHLLELAERRGQDHAAVDAWQARAIVRQSRGELASALDARRSAARAARAAGLQEREAVLTMNVGFALTTIGARNEALHEIESGLAKAQAIGSSGAVRQGQMLLLGWAATFGADTRLDPALAEPRAAADEAASGSWVVRDRTTLGVLFYRGCELLRGEGSSALPRVRVLLRTAAEAYRSTENRDVLPAALGFWAEAERRSGNAEHAIGIAREAAELLEGGAPSLLNEAPVYLALHDASVDLGDLRGARAAVERAIPMLLRRLGGLSGTSYARSFLTGLPHNAGLLAAAEAYGLVPPAIEELLAEAG